MKKDKTIIYLAEVAHNGFGLSLKTIPLGIGTVAAYCKQQHGNAVEIKLFRQFEDLLLAVKEDVPHIVGFGYYSWSDNLTLASAAHIRELCPDSLIVLGGQNISFRIQEDVTGSTGGITEAENYSASYSKKVDIALLESNPAVDLIIHGDGELPFSDVVKYFIDSRDRLKVKAAMPVGCSSLVEAELLSGKEAPLISDLDIVPSPYLMGLYTDFFDRFQLMPQIETVRGCPYTCSYCTIGGNINRLRKHSFDYVKEEVLYLMDKSPNRILRIADSNWGILKGDIKLAEFLYELHESSGYPTSLRVYYAEKGPINNIKEMARKLKVLLPLNISFQTLNSKILKNIKRNNMPLDDVKDMVGFAHQNNISVSTELISGLPGESYDSFKENFLKIIELGFDSIYTQSLYLIKGSELYNDINRKRYSYKTMYSLIGSDVTKIDSRYIFEADEVVVESNTMSKDDFWRLHKLKLFFFLCYGAAFFKEIIMYCLKHNITPLDVYDEILDDFQKYPFLNKTISEYIQNVKLKYFESLDELEKALTQSIEKTGRIDRFSIPSDLLQVTGSVLSSKNKRLFISEYIEAVNSLFSGTNDNNEEFSEILNMLGDLTFDIIISPIEKTDEVIVREFNYDLVSWTQDGFSSGLEAYSSKKPIAVSMKIRNMQEHIDLIACAGDWNDREKYEYYFTTTVSSNMRRFISCD